MKYLIICLVVLLVIFVNRTCEEPRVNPKCYRNNCVRHQEQQRHRRRSNQDNESIRKRHRERDNHLRFPEHRKKNIHEERKDPMQRSFDKTKLKKSNNSGHSKRTKREPSHGFKHPPEMRKSNYASSQKKLESSPTNHSKDLYKPKYVPKALNTDVNLPVEKRISDLKTEVFSNAKRILRKDKKEVSANERKDENLMMDMLKYLLEIQERKSEITRLLEKNASPPEHGLFLRINLDKGGSLPSEIVIRLKPNRRLEKENDEEEEYRREAND